MSTQAELPHGTQLISQSFYQSVIEKAKSTRCEDQQAQSDTPRTYKEGDSGHVDITSSFVTRREHPVEEEAYPAGSDPVEVSPQSSYQQLTQFPESQRFKTPVTAGKKRTHDGDVIDTPAPVRNPLIWDGQAVQSEALGLSQAFAATQAPSSPFSNGLPTGPRSDRPSPNIELQTRPATTTSSSPLLRPIIDLKRAATEPASRYVPMRQSQADREQLERSHLLQTLNAPDDNDDDFEEEDSVIARKRRQRIREQNAIRELKSLSSPLIAPQDMPDSSPPKFTSTNPADNKPESGSPDTLRAATATKIDDEAMALASEAESEQNEDAYTETRCISLSLDDDIDEDDTAVLLVPKTIQKRKVHTNSVTAHVDASPSLGHTRRTPTARRMHEVISSEPLRIMDSQPSQTKPRFVNAENIMSSASDVVDFVERPLQSNGSPTLSANPRHVIDDNNSHVDTPGVPITHGPVTDTDTDTEATTSTAKALRRSIVDETSSTLRVGEHDNPLANGSSQNRDLDNTTLSETDFETAQSHIKPRFTASRSQTSSPVRTMPPGRKRRRMLDISAENSPRKTMSQPAFDAAAILRLDDDQQAASLLQSSPHTRALQRKHEVTDIVNVESLLAADEAHDPPILTDFPEVSMHSPDLNGRAELLPVTTVDSSLEVSQDIVRPGRQTRPQAVAKETKAQYEQVVQLSADVRRSIFDIQASPEERIVPQLRHRARPKTLKTDEKSTKDVTMHESRMKKRLQTEATGNHDTPRVATVSSNVPVKHKTHNNDKGESDMTTPSGDIIASDMVFAYYKGDPRGYYPARFLGPVESGCYQVQWEGCEPVVIDTFGVKALDIRKGDTVKVLADGFTKIPYVILGFRDKFTKGLDEMTDIRGYRTLVVAPKQRKSFPADPTKHQQREVSVASIYLDVNMWAQLKQRNHPFESTMGSIMASSITTPMYHTSTPSSPHSKDRRQSNLVLPQSSTACQGIFSSMAFAMSYDTSPQKNLLGDLVLANGGVVIQDSFDDLLDTDTMKLKPHYESLGFTALLTDRHSRKEKYVQALALGIPCLSGKWIQACVRHGSLVDWRSYLLPAGESAELDNATRSRVLPATYASDMKLKDMLETRSRLLQDLNVVVVVGRGKTELKRAPYLFLIEALGADHVHRVPDLRSTVEYLTSQESKQCQWAFVDDRDVQALQKLLDESAVHQKTGTKAKAGSGKETTTTTQCKVAGNELIVQSLILGRLYDG